MSSVARINRGTRFGLPGNGGRACCWAARRAPAMTKTQKTNRVDRLVERAKNHPVIAVIFILALVVFAVAKLADSEKAITDAWKR
jgi:hypothetical protein